MFDTFLIFAQNIDCGYTLEPPAHNLSFGAKIRKIDIPLHTPVLLYKSGVYGGIHCTDMLYILHSQVLLIFKGIPNIDFMGPNLIS